MDVFRVYVTGAEPLAVLLRPHLTLRSVLERACAALHVDVDTVRVLTPDGRPVAHYDVTLDELGLLGVHVELSNERVAAMETSSSNEGPDTSDEVSPASITPPRVPTLISSVLQTHLTPRTHSGLRTVHSKSIMSVATFQDNSRVFYEFSEAVSDAAAAADNLGARLAHQAALPPSKEAEAMFARPLWLRCVPLEYLCCHHYPSLPSSGLYVRADPVPLCALEYVREILDKRTTLAFVLDEPENAGRESSSELCGVKSCGVFDQELAMSSVLDVASVARPYEVFIESVNGVNLQLLRLGYGESWYS